MTTKYYWLKLKRDFFKRHDVKVIESMPNGKDYVLFYLKLLLESVDHDGALRFSDTIPYDENMLSIVTNTNIDVVRAALQLLQKLQLVEIMEDKTIYMEELQGMIGGETDWARKKRDYRLSHINDALQIADKTRTKKDNVRQEIEKEIEIDTELEKEKENGDKSPRFCPPIIENKTKNENKKKKVQAIKHQYGTYQNVLLTDDDVQALRDKFPDYEAKIQGLSEGIELKGYVYKNHYLAILTWARNDKAKFNGQRGERPKQNFAGVTYTDETLSKFEDDPAALIAEMKKKQRGEREEV